MSYQYHSRKILSPGSSRKRKEKETFHPFKPQLTVTAKPTPSIKAEESIRSSNQLLAGYMAYEYLTKGTLFGQKFDPGRAEAVPLLGKPPVMEPARKKREELKGYDEVASILKTKGAHIPGIVNPAQLARWIQM